MEYINYPDVHLSPYYVNNFLLFLVWRTISLRFNCDVKYKINIVHTSGYVVVRGEYLINNIFAISLVALELGDIISLKHDRKYSLWCIKSGEIS